LGEGERQRVCPGGQTAIYSEKLDKSQSSQPAPNEVVETSSVTIAPSGVSICLRKPVSCRSNERVRWHTDFPGAFGLASIWPVATAIRVGIWAKSAESLPEYLPISRPKTAHREIGVAQTLAREYQRGMASKARRSRQRKLGRAFERTIASVQTELDPGASVTHNERLIDRHGHWRQFDVVIRGKLGGHEILGVIECKDLKRKVSTPAVEAFVTKTASLRAELKIMVSRFGFSKPALELAAHHGIRAMSLLKPDKRTKGVSVGNYIYARRFTWGSARAGATLVDGSSRPIDQPLETITINGLPIWGWLMSEAYTTYRFVDFPGWHSLRLVFRSMAQLTLSDQTWEISGLEIQLRRDVDYLRKPAFATGKGLVEFNPNALHVPEGAELETSFSINHEFTDWEIFDEIPASLPPLFPIILNAFWVPESLPESNFPALQLAEITMAPVPPTPVLHPTRATRRQKRRSDIAK